MQCYVRESMSAVFGPNHAQRERDAGQGQSLGVAASSNDPASVEAAADASFHPFHQTRRNVPGLEGETDYVMIDSQKASTYDVEKLFDLRDRVPPKDTHWARVSGYVLALFAAT